MISKALSGPVFHTLPKLEFPLLWGFFFFQSRTHWFRTSPSRECFPGPRLHISQGWTREPYGGFDFLAILPLCLHGTSKSTLAIETVTCSQNVPSLCVRTQSVLSQHTEKTKPYLRSEGKADLLPRETTLSGGPNTLHWQSIRGIRASCMPPLGEPPYTLARKCIRKCLDKEWYHSWCRQRGRVGGCLLELQLPYQ